jgi:hypothetical protein
MKFKSCYIPHRYITGTGDSSLFSLCLRSYFIRNSNKLILKNPISTLQGRIQNHFSREEFLDLDPGHYTDPQEHYFKEVNLLYLYKNPEEAVQWERERDANQGSVTCPTGYKTEFWIRNDFFTRIRLGIIFPDLVDPGLDLTYFENGN